MKHTARISQRKVTHLDRSSNQAKVNIQMQLAAMQCKRLGHVPGKAIRAGAERKVRHVCTRCWHVVEDDKAEVADAEVV